MTLAVLRTQIFIPTKLVDLSSFTDTFQAGEKKILKNAFFSPDGKVSVELPRSSSSVGVSVELPRSAVLKAPNFRQPKSVRKTAKVRSFTDVVLTRWKSVRKTA